MKYIITPLYVFLWKFVVVFLCCGMMYYIVLLLIFLWDFKIPSYKEFPFHKEDGVFFTTELYYTPLDYLLNRNRLKK